MRETHVLNKTRLKSRWVMNLLDLHHTKEPVFLFMTIPEPSFGHAFQLIGNNNNKKTICVTSSRMKKYQIVLFAFFLNYCNCQQFNDLDISQVLLSGRQVIISPTFNRQLFLYKSVTSVCVLYIFST